MRRHVPSNLDDLDFDALEMAKAAARRAGLSLEEWASRVLAGRREERSTPALRPLRKAGDPDSAPSQHPKAQISDHEALMAAAAAESERQAYERLARAPEADGPASDQPTASRTAIALESMASWIEQAEKHRNEAARTIAPDQDRMASALTQALSALKDRLDTVERHVVSDRAPPRIEFPVQDAIKALAPLSETLVGLRMDVSRLADRLEQPNLALTPAVDGIREDIERLRSDMGGLATRDEIAALDRAIRDVARGLARDLEQGRSSKDLLTLAHSMAALYEQVQTLSSEAAEGVHRRIGSEIDLIKSKIDKVAETGVDRSVIEFLSGQILDMRQDLAHRAEPQQIERLSGEIAALGRQVAELHDNQVDRSDFTALKTSLENVCFALNRTAAVQEASTVPEQLQSLSRRLDVLVNRPEFPPADLDPIAEQLALLTERMAGLSGSHHDQADALAERIDRLSSQIAAVAEREPPSHAPLMERFDRIEQELRQVCQKTDASPVETMLRSIDEKLERPPSGITALDSLEQRIVSLADRLDQTPGDPLLLALNDATAHLKNLHNEAADIAERAARTVLKDVQTSLPDASDLDALKRGLVEMKALQARADKKTQQTLRAVHDALDIIVSRFQDHGPAIPPLGGAPEAASDPSLGRLPPADRLEAAVRRLHAATLSQIEEVAAPGPQTAPHGTVPETLSSDPEFPRTVAASVPPQDADLGNVRASFIAAARRAAQTAAPEREAPALLSLVKQDDGPGAAGDEAADENALSPPSLMERLRRTFESHRRPLLFGLAFLILAAGTAQILSTGSSSPALASTPAEEAAQAAREKSPAAKAQPVAPAKEAVTGSIAKPETDLFQPASMGSAPQSSPLAASLVPASPPAPKFIVDPSTVGEIPPMVPVPLRQAARAGDAAAIFEIASRAAEGRGLDKDMILAVRLFERAAQAGLPPAQERLASLYETGTGIWRDPKQAVVWYERAAQGGNIRAMHNLGTLLASGTVGKPDYAAALRWYAEAAESGWRDSQFNMGVLLTRGAGSKPDLAKAYQWFSLAANQGDAEARKKRDEIAMRLSTEELGSAKVAVERWRPRAVDPIANEVPLPAVGQAPDRTSDNRN